MPMEAFRDDLRRLGEVAELRRLDLLGGEPCLHPDIDKILLIARCANITRDVGLVTNGQLLDKMTERFWKTLTRLQLHRYPGKTTDDEFRRIQERCAENGITLQVIEVKEFFHCIRRGGDGTPEEAQQRFTGCLMAHLCMVLDYGHLYACPPSSAVARLFLKDCEPTVDGLPLAGITPGKLLAFMKRKTPLRACRRCSVNESIFPWRETTREKWIEDSTCPLK